MTEAEDPTTTEPVPEVAGSSRDEWLEVAMTDLDCGAAALATAARHGRPLPPLQAD